LIRRSQQPAVSGTGMGAALGCAEPQVTADRESELKATDGHNDAASSVGMGRDIGNAVDLDFLDVREALPTHGLQTYASLVDSQIFSGPEARRAARTNSQPGDGRVTLHMLSECVTPLFFDLVECLAASPRDCIPLCSIVSHSFAVLGRPISDALWSMMYMHRWPAFHECMRFYDMVTWNPLYQDTMLGKVTCALEIYHREKKRGFAMSCMPALVYYEQKRDAYLAKYVTANNVPLETIPVREECRLRFVPSSARCLLQPELDAAQPPTQAPPKPVHSVAAAKLATAAHSPRCHFLATPALTSLASAANSSYSYTSITGIDEGLRIGAGLELQWRMQSDSPFGWWYGELEDLKRQPGASVAKATIVFKHYPPHSRWYRKQVIFGDGEIRDSSFGGETGGIRSTSLDLQQQWYSFLPTAPAAGGLAPVVGVPALPALTSA